MTPQPVCRSPGSSPKTRIEVRYRPGEGSGTEPRHHVFPHFEIGVDVLDIVAVLERLEQLEKGSLGLLVDPSGRPRAPDEVRRAGRPKLAFQRIAHGFQIFGRTSHDVLAGLALDVFRAGLDD